MRVTVEKTTERPIIIAVRDDGVSLRVRTPDRKFSPPHDLILRSATMPSRSTAVTDISMIFLWNGFIGMSVFAKSMRGRQRFNAWRSAARSIPKTSSTVWEKNDDRSYLAWVGHPRQSRGLSESLHYQSSPALEG